MYRYKKNFTLKILLLTLLVLSTFRGSSQTVIRPVTNDSTVSLPKGMAISALKDLNKKDALEKENKLLKQDTSTLRLEIEQYRKDSIKQAEKDRLYSDIRLQSTAKDAKYEESLKELKSELSWSKARTTGSQLLLLAAVVLLIITR